MPEAPGWELRLVGRWHVASAKFIHDLFPNLGVFSDVCRFLSDNRRTAISQTREGDLECANVLLRAETYATAKDGHSLVEVARIRSYTELAVLLPNRVANPSTDVGTWEMELIGKNGIVTPPITPGAR